MTPAPAPRSPHRSLFLLGSLLLLFLPLEQLGAEQLLKGRLIDILVGTMLVTAVYSFSESKKHLVGILCVAVPTFVLRWIESPDVVRSPLLAAAQFFGMLFALYVTCLCLDRVFRAKRVTADTLVNGITGYLLLGTLWAGMYGVLNATMEGAFVLPEHGSAEQQERILFDFSFVTLTTLGYGDVTPKAPAARHLAALEAIVGQLYVAILIARLVALHVMHGTQQDDDGRPK